MNTSAKQTLDFIAEGLSESTPSVVLVVDEGIFVTLCSSRDGEIYSERIDFVTAIEVLRAHGDANFVVEHEPVELEAFLTAALTFKDVEHSLPLTCSIGDAVDAIESELTRLGGTVHCRIGDAHWLVRRS